MQLSIEPLLQAYVFSELSSSNNMMRARACWVYGQFGKFPFNNQDHLRGALNAIYENLHHQDLPVRVEAALALNNLLNHEIAIEFIRPGLESLLKTYLKIMDDIDFDALVHALQNIVDIYGEQIAPFAVGLCNKLGEAFVRLINSKGSGENEDQETSLTADGLMSAIRRVLESISGKYKELYPQLEEILEQPLQLTLTEAGASAVEDGISCISELLYNQETISVRMWNFY